MIIVGTSCSNSKTKNKAFSQPHVRGLVDTIGFSQYAWQTDSVVARIYRFQGDSIKNLPERILPWKVCISPHDDYAYAGYQYLNVLSNLKAKTVIMFGVAHKARNYHLENKILFDSYPYWLGPYGRIRVSPIREKLIQALDTGLFEVHDTMQTAEHSLEALVPFLQYFNRQIEIVPILVPYMSYSRMQEIASPLSDALHRIIESEGLSWGKDIALVISTDAVHYGDQAWGGKNYAPYGTDKKGTKEALAHEYEIIQNCLAGDLNLKKIKKFTEYTVKSGDFRQYKWTWCGRYSVPFGLSTAWYLEKSFSPNPLKGIFIGYSNSIDHDQLPVSDLGMGVTAPASSHHWVGYPALGYVEKTSYGQNN